MEGKRGMVFQSGFLKDELRKKYGRNRASVIPSDYCYNRVNSGIEFGMESRLFIYVERNTYEYVGEGFPYTGLIYHKPKKSKSEIAVGEWINGELIYLT